MEYQLPKIFKDMSQEQLNKIIKSLIGDNVEFTIAENLGFSLYVVVSDEKQPLSQSSDCEETYLFKSSHICIHPFNICYAYSASEIITTDWRGNKIEEYGHTMECFTKEKRSQMDITLQSTLSEIVPNYETLATEYKKAIVSSLEKYIYKMKMEIEFKKLNNYPKSEIDDVTTRLENTIKESERLKTELLNKTQTTTTEMQ